MPQSTDSPVLDLLIVGGGINGAGIARDAAGRGLKVLLCERDDLAAHTSSASTKLIHGGLRYLEYYEFRLVAKALREREILLQAAPHIIWPMRFVMPHVAQLRPRWMIRLGLFLYDSLGGRMSLPRSEALNLKTHAAGRVLRDHLQHGFAYSDCWVEDARLVVLNCLDAAERGADIRTHTSCVHAERQDGLWHVTLRDGDSGEETICRARTLVNAAGPWVAGLLTGDNGKPKKSVRLVKGSHLVVPRIGTQDEAYILQNPDRRIVFVIPFEQHYSLVGTTEEVYGDDPATPHISEAEISYLCETVDRFFKQSITPDDVVWSYSGVRPLFDDASANASAVTRDYVLDMDGDEGAPPLLSIFGGKITTYRRLAEDVMALLQDTLQTGAPAWTARQPLPGGDIAKADMDAWRARLAEEYPWLPEPMRYRLAYTYGTRIHRLLEDAESTDDLGIELGEGLFERELRYLRDTEWARTAEDALWRRTRLGLHLSATQRQAVADWFATNGQPVEAVANAAGVAEASS